MSISGGCLCGAVSYSCSGESVMAGNCHCVDCKKSSGSGYAPSMFFPEASVAILGEVKYFSSRGKNGAEVSRGFCPNCGSQLFGKPSATAGLISIRAGTLDNANHYKPQLDIYTSHAVAWDAMDDKLPKFPEMPPGE